jgi:hypothetical protein
MRSLIRALAALTLVLASAALGTRVLDPPRAAAGSAPASPAAAAAKWLTGQLADDAMPGPFNPVDWGLTIDALLALRSAGTEPATADKVTAAVAGHVDSYATGADWGMPDYRIGGATAKVLVAATASGADPTTFGGQDMRQRTLDLIAGKDAGDEQGWIETHAPGSAPTGGNLFDQSLAVIGLARSGGVPQSVVGFLAKQECDGGGFRLFPAPGGAPCTAAPAAEQIPDVDTTAMAVQALIAGRAAGATGTQDGIDRGTAWLLSAQKPDGSFQGSVVTEYSNTNSTGLAGQALAAAGQTEAAAKAAVFVADQQLTGANGGAAAEQAGAIAYTPQTLTDAEANGIPGDQLDQWRRATAQAMLGLTRVPMGEIGEGGATTPPPPTGTPTPPGGTPAPTPSVTPPGDDDPSPTPSPSRHSPAGAAPSAGGGHGGRLPFTGAPIAWLGALGGGGVVVGGLLLAAVRFRRLRTPRRG